MTTTYRSEERMTLKPDFQSFQKEIAFRGIEYLIHFTPTINLLSILTEHCTWSSGLTLERQERSVLRFLLISPS